MQIIYSPLRDSHKFRKKFFRARKKYRSFCRDGRAIVNKMNELTNVSRVRTKERDELGNVAREHDGSECSIFAVRAPKGASPLAPAHTRASAVILSYGGLYHQFSRPGSGAASSIGSQDISACLYGARCTLRVASLARQPCIAPYPMSHNTTVTRNNLTCFPTPEFHPPPPPPPLCLLCVPLRSTCLFSRRRAIRHPFFDT